MYTEELTAHAQRRVELTGELRRAIAQNELRLFYQPIHNLHTRRIEGVEALGALAASPARHGVTG